MSLMQTALNRLEDRTIELTITVPWTRVKESYNKLFEKALSEIEVEGFRKGKAPKKLAEEKVDKEKVYQAVIREIIPQFYAEAIKEQNLQPIIAPRIELLAAKENEDWQFKASLCEKPEVKLNDYKRAIQEFKQKKRTKIWVPGQETKQQNKRATEQQKPSLSEVLETILKVAKVKIPQILIDEEVNRMLADLVDQTQKIGLSIEQYLKAKRKTPQQLRKEQKIQAERTLALQFVLEEIADEEKITVSDKEIDELINKEKNKKTREQLKIQKYYLASFLRRQKTIEALVRS